MFDLLNNIESNEFSNKMFLLYILINYCHTENLKKV